MQLHTLQPKHAWKSARPRVGRGGKRGTTSGRGQKGQGAHGGRRIPSGLKEILSRLPKLRGINNPPTSEKPSIVNLDDLKKFGAVTINREFLLKNKLINKDARNIKILGRGKIDRALNIERLAISKSAKEKVEAAGGKVK